MNLFTQLCLVWGVLSVAVPAALYLARTGDRRRIDEQQVRRQIRRELMRNHPPQGDHQ
jgi:dephospho-CoA kinase